MQERRTVWIGFDPREADAFAVARSSTQLWNPYLPVRGLVLSDLQRRGLYSRPMEVRDGRLWDVISEAPMSTEFAISRFLVPHLAQKGWALFMDSDVLVRVNLARLFEQADGSKAVMCVKHHHEPPEGEKMDGQTQTRYARKNWSSVMLFNCDHKANEALTVGMVNKVPGRELHRFYWLEDDLIGELDPEWNYLVGHTEINSEPHIVHFTEGIPRMRGYETQPYAEEWFAELARWAA
jgi:lipopolysaccharide biosynthesis glycosyltransferase